MIADGTPIRDDFPRRHIEWRAEWFDGRTHAIETLQRFGCDPEVFRRRAISAAYRRGLRIETSRKPGEAVIYLKRK